MVKILKNDRWINHPWALTGFVENIKTDFLKSISNNDAKKYTDLLNGDLVHQNIVWNDIKQNGLYEPLLILIGFDNKTIRLESGNHRISTAIEDGITHLPTAILVMKESLMYEGNGFHYYCAKKIINWDNVIKCSYPYQINPLKILKRDLILNDKK